MAQHFVPLSFTANSGSLTVQTPANSALAPYGNYMLFIVNKKGVPSVSTPLNLSRRTHGAGRPHRRERDRRRRQRHRDLDRPSPGTSPITSYTVTPYIGSTAQIQHGRQRLATGDQHHDHRTEKRHHLHIHRDRDQRRRQRASLGKIECRDALSSHRAGRADGPNGHPGNASATVTWSAPANNGSPITSYTVTPYLGSTAQTATTITGSPPATSTTITGLINGDTYTSP